MDRIKKCRQCGNIYGRNKGYVNKQWINSKFCSLSCHGRSRKQPTVYCSICNTPTTYGKIKLCDLHYRRLKRYGDANHEPQGTYTPELIEKSNKQYDEWLKTAKPFKQDRVYDETRKAR